MRLFRVNEKKEKKKQLQGIKLARRYQLSFYYFDLLHAGCGPVIENTLRSPGYPNDYPNNTDCVSSVPIPQGMVINVTINKLYLEDSISCE